MCRFLAYLGEEVKMMGDLVIRPSNSLLHQSREPTEGRTKFHADGFGLGWYSPNHLASPAVFKSVQPVWSDQNLVNLANNIETTCFIAHVRASTVGAVNMTNCHPFSHNQMLFAHNGSIRDFSAIKYHLYKNFEEQFLNEIQGQTDSEHFFVYLQQVMAQMDTTDCMTIADVFRQALNDFLALQERYAPSANCYVNVILTDGQWMMASRFTKEDDEDSLGFYYTNHETVTDALLRAKNDGKFFMCASERLTPSDEWLSLPMNHLILVDRDFNQSILPI